MITVEDAADVAAFKDYTPTSAVEAADTAAPVAAPAAEAPVAAAAAPPPPAPKTAPAAPPPPAPVAAAPSTAPAAASFSTAWGLSVTETSPLARTLAAEQNRYIALYGTTGQAPILPTSSS